MLPYIASAFLATVACVWAEARDRKRVAPRSSTPPLPTGRGFTVGSR